jgi:hypothetical protein
LRDAKRPLQKRKCAVKMQMGENGPQH